ncbi:hypothetical protein Mgra_00008480 [Meloidogyne graminicola]|uniref:Uncharacterized protein n=1 Tax=Meloidogyne graminicola TaxID=189291 RepID=A0A8S9ZFL2_9BILA|nr:hypothetical protein Mgra_00008480 [Meloidogyne graminicola]
MQKEYNNKYNKNIIKLPAELIFEIFKGIDLRNKFKQFIYELIQQTSNDFDSVNERVKNLGNQTLMWLGNNHKAEKEVYENKFKEFKESYSKIISTIILKEEIYKQNNNNKNKSFITDHATFMMNKNFKEYAIKLVSSSKIVYILIGKLFNKFYKKINKKILKKEDYSSVIFQSTNSSFLESTTFGSYLDNLTVSKQKIISQNSFISKGKIMSHEHDFTGIGDGSTGPTFEEMFGLEQTSGNVQSSSTAQDVDQFSLNTPQPVISPTTEVRKHFVGIDFGTNYCRVSVYKNGKVEILANDKGHVTTPSIIAFDDNDFLIGNSVNEQIHCLNPQNTIFDIKRLIGLNWNDYCIQNLIRHRPFSVMNQEGGMTIQVEFRNENKTLHPIEICSMLLTKMKRTAEAHYGDSVTDAVIAVPANFNAGQRRAIIDACFIAGINVFGLINEPTATALAYGLSNKMNVDRNILIFDLGGGTFDVSVVSIVKGTSFYVKSTAGDTHLGGEDFTDLLVNYIKQKLIQKYGYDISNDPYAVRRLRIDAEQIKQTLSTSEKTALQFNIHGVIKLVIYRCDFEQLCMHLFKKMMKLVEQVLSNADLNKDRIDEIIMVGGSCNIPKVEEMLSAKFPNKKINLLNKPKHPVAYGAAIWAAILSGVIDLNTIGVSISDPFLLEIETPGINNLELQQMVENATRFEEASLKYSERMNIIYKLKSGVYEAINDFVFADERVKNLGNQTLTWLKNNEKEEKEVYENKFKEFKESYSKIMSTITLKDGESCQGSRVSRKRRHEE